MFIVPFNVANVIEFLLLPLCSLARFLPLHGRSFCPGRGKARQLLQERKKHELSLRNSHAHFVITLCESVERRRLMHNGLAWAEWKLLWLNPRNSIKPFLSIIVAIINFLLVFVATPCFKKFLRTKFIFEWCKSLQPGAVVVKQLKAPWRLHCYGYSLSLYSHYPLCKFDNTVTPASLIS